MPPPVRPTPGRAGPRRPAAIRVGRRPGTRSAVRAAGRAAVRIVAAVLLAAVVAGLPAALVVFVGWPLPRTVPSPEQLSAWATAPITDTVILNTLAVAAWLLWAAFLHSLAVEAVAAWRGLPTRASTGRSANPLRLAAAGLITAITLGTVLTGTAAAAGSAPAHAAPPATTPSATAPSATAPLAAGPAAYPAPAATTARPTAARTADTRSSATEPPAVLRVGTTAHPYTVRRGDTLSAIARDWLGDADRWQEICRLNRHRHWPAVGGTLTDCDLIYPGWDLRLPADARPPAAAKPATPPAPNAPKAPTGKPAPGQQQKPASPPPTSSPSTPAPTSPAPATAPANPGPSAPAPAAPAPSSPATTTPQATPSPTAGTAEDPDGVTTAEPGATRPSGDTTVAAPPDLSKTPASPPASSGVELPSGSYVPWALATAITAAAAMVWLRRRRRYRPDTTTAYDPDTAGPGQLPAPVAEVHRQVVRNPDLPLPPDPAERAAAVPVLPVLPPGGLGLTGDGAASAARAALVSALASGGPAYPDRRGEVVIDGSTLSTLIGVDAAALGPWPRLHITDDLAHAVALLDSRMLYRSRILDEHRLDDLDQLRADAPGEEALPPVLLITDTPEPGVRMRTRASIELGAALDVTALFLGDWPYGPTVSVDSDGHLHQQAQPDGAATEPPHGLPTRLAVLDADDAVAILSTLREAHTGEPTSTRTSSPLAGSPPPASAPNADSDSAPADQDTSEEETATTGEDDAPPNSAPDEVADRPGPEPATSHDTTAPDTTAPDTTAHDSTIQDSTAREAPVRESSRPAAPKPASTVQLRVLGHPRIDKVTAPGRSLRSPAAELAVYLACHPDGSDTITIAEYLIPEDRRRTAIIKIHTDASNLRHVFGRAGGQIKGGYVLKGGPDTRYRLDPDAVAVDLWQLRDLLSRADLTGREQRVDLLRQACDLYTGPLAQGCDYEWVDPYRERARATAIEAHHRLAAALMPDDPGAALTVLQTAIGHDPYNEESYCAAMRAHHALGDADGIRTMFRALRRALADIDTEPTDETATLAASLRAGLTRP